jgi:hypothetical protein
MNPEESPSVDYDRPVAYDVDGKPLYAHPAAEEAKLSGPAQVVHMTRPSEPEKPFISDATKIKHDSSKKLYPDLNLSEGEYIIAAVRRHPIGLILPLVLGVVLVALSLSVLFNYDLFVQTFQLRGPAADVSTAFFPIVLFILLVCIGTYMAYYIYSNNRFYLTNESVIQELQLCHFNHREQTVSLGSVEDASYVQDGLIQEMLNYGSLRLSTVGDETTYTFPFVGNPKERIAALNNAVEAFKNGRPVDGK